MTLSTRSTATHFRPLSSISVFCAVTVCATLTLQRFERRARLLDAHNGRKRLFIGVAIILRHLFLLSMSTMSRILIGSPLFSISRNI